jgi:hypothetical protein
MPPGAVRSLLNAYIDWWKVAMLRPRQVHRWLDFSPGQLRIENRAMPVSTASSTQVQQAIHGRNARGWQRYARQLEPLRQRLQDDGWL